MKYTSRHMFRFDKGEVPCFTPHPKYGTVSIHQADGDGLSIELECEDVDEWVAGLRQVQQKLWAERAALLAAEEDAMKAEATP